MWRRLGPRLRQHDTWPGIVPLVYPWNHKNRDRIAGIPMLGGDWSAAIQIETPVGIPLVFGRLNSVARSFANEVLASGSLSSFPHDDLPVASLLEQFREQFALHRDRSAVRITLLHNPPHAFAAGYVDQLTTAYLRDAAALADALADARVQLVLCGHRHALDPPPGSEDYGWTQRPLRSPTVQLAAETPTQRGGRASPTDWTDRVGRTAPTGSCWTRPPRRWQWREPPSGTHPV
jgi:hypothetical protein